MRKNYDLTTTTTTTKKEKKRRKRIMKERERTKRIMNAPFGRSLQAPGVFIVKSFIRGNEGGDETNEIKWSFFGKELVIVTFQLLQYKRLKRMSSM